MEGNFGIKTHLISPPFLFLPLLEQTGEHISVLDERGIESFSYQAQN